MPPRGCDETIIQNVNLNGNFVFNDSVFSISGKNSEVNLTKSSPQIPVRSIKRILVPLRKGKSTKITIKYDDGEEQTWIDRSGYSTSEPVPFTIRANNDMPTEIYFVYEDGGVQIQQSSKAKEKITFYSESENYCLNVTLANGNKHELKPGFHLELIYKEVEEKRLTLKGDHIEDLEKNDWPFDAMYMSEDFDAKMKKNFEKFLLNYDCDRV